MKRKILNYLLLLTFICTIMVPLTGLIVHKLASALFLLLCVVHTIANRERLGGRSFLLLGLVAIAFVSGILGMILEELPLLLALHKGISIVVVFFMAIHIFVYHRKMRRN